MAFSAAFSPKTTASPPFNSQPPVGERIHKGQFEQLIPDPRFGGRGEIRHKRATDQNGPIRITPDFCGLQRTAFFVANF